MAGFPFRFFSERLEYYEIKNLLKSVASVLVNKSYDKLWTFLLKYFNLI